MGADWSLLWSPAKVKLVVCPLVLVPACMLAGRNSIQGTATCLPPAEVAEVPPAPPLKEITAKSIRPEVGLMMVSLMVPSVSPELLLTSAPVNWLARISW